MDAGLYTEIRRHCPLFHLERVENRTGNPGFPDLIMLHRPTKIVAFVELKELFETSMGFSMNMRKGQPGWHLEWARAGGRSFIFAKSQADRYVLIRSRSNYDWVKFVSASFQLPHPYAVDWHTMDWRGFEKLLIL